MAASQSSQPPASSSAIPSVTTTPCLDPMDSFINYDPVYTSPSVQSGGKNPITQPPSFATSNFTVPSQQHLGAQQVQVFSGPSHQYDLHTQQTGLPPGGIANTLAVNEANMQYNMFSNAYLGMNSVLDSTMTGLPIFAGGAGDMDLELDSPESSIYPQSAHSDCVDPSQVAGQDLKSSPSPAVPSQVYQRAWPGMHQQQAALAKAQAQARQQKQQQLVNQRQKAGGIVQAQIPRPSLSVTYNPHDPAVEEKISHILNQMRQNSATISFQDTAPTPSVLHPITRAKKDEDEMDEDERLLNSEEGKKLSSKERRQLRNKVSARAFRSRRKEYIAQLEGDISAKASELNELKLQNHALVEENRRLSDLTRMLLSSSAFSNFLNNLSSSNPNLAEAQSQYSQSNQQMPAQNIPKDANPNQMLQQNNPQINMTLVPEATVDMAALNLESNYNTNFALNAEVFSVSSVPDGPAVDHVDAAPLSDKEYESDSFVSRLLSVESKDQKPCIESVPEIPKQKESLNTTPISNPEIELDESDPAFALFVDDAIEPSQCDESDAPLFGGVDPEKVFARYELIIEDDCDVEARESGEVSVVAIARFEHFCACMEPILERINLLVPDI